MRLERKENVLHTFLWLIIKLPLTIKNVVFRQITSIPNKSSDYGVIELYDENQKINTVIKDSIIKNKGEIIIGNKIVKCWISGYYSIEKLKIVKRIRLNNNLYVNNVGLYYNDMLVVCFTKIERDEFYYIDYKDYCVGDKHYFAFRTASRLFVSESLVDWEEIYNNKRGIKNSMLFTKRDGDVILIFIEYTPGTIRERHHILEYCFSNRSITISKVFYTYNEYLENNCLDCCRHIHVIDRDPFTNDIFVGTGDNDIESAIWVSKNNGKSYHLLYRRGQLGRTLSFMFTEESVFWTMDSHEPQFIVRYDRKTKETELFPIVNGALWHSFRVSIKGKTLNIIGSNSEGAHFDNNNRVYGVLLDNETPIVYELTCCKSCTQYDQLFPVYAKGNEVYLYHILGGPILRGTIRLK